MIRFGPSGLGGVEEAIANLKEYHKLGLKACEVAFTYNVYLNKEQAIEIGKVAKELDIALSVHSPYFVNLNSAEKPKIHASMNRILKCCEIAHSLGARRVVFHPGYYGKMDKEKTYENVKQRVNEMLAVIKEKKWDVEICAETMGKINVFGSLEEISKLAKETGCGFVLDFAHILARYKEVDMKNIEKLFPEKHWQCHFSGIVYGDKGEKHHKLTEEKEWKNLLENLPKNKEIIIINESPNPVNDSVDGMKLSAKIN